MYSCVSPLLDRVAAMDVVAGKLDVCGFEVLGQAVVEFYVVRASHSRGRVRCAEVLLIRREKLGGPGRMRACL